MSKTLRRTFAVAPFLLLSFAVAGCPEPPKPVEPKPTLPPPPPPKPKPKCEKLEEECAAAPSTAAKIAETQFVFTPPEEWIFAQTPDGAIAQVDDKGPVMALGSIEATSDAGQARKLREEKVDALLKLVGLVPPGGKKLALAAKPPDKLEGTELKAIYWQVDNAKRGTEAGGLLVLAVLAGEREILGVGYAPANDKSGSDAAIMAALGSLKKKAGSSSK
ncbi:MAG: hypothetical protein IT373_05390 [Polyangiaceae bacterium]|nr:hypothetical protein [Polyangiaceae bacterium]